MRTKNQLNPGPSSSNLGGPNLELTATHFPISPTYDDIAGSQGFRASTFLSISKTGVESTTTPTGFRQVTGDHSPSAVNAVFNHRQFWNGRAQPDFNGVNPFGSRDTSARVWVLDYRGNPVQVYINIRDASLASQAVGPPLNPVEMSAAGRTFPELGKKMLLAKPLGLQQVSATDSVLGPVADTTTGLKTTYTALIQQAFQPKWWNSIKSVSVGGKSYTMMQANFSLYWGLALMLYQATLVSDDSRQVLRTTLRNFGFLGKRFFSAWSLFLLVGLIFILITLVYVTIAKMLPKTGIGPLLLFLWQQVYFLARLWTCVLFFATEYHFLKAQSRSRLRSNL